MRSMALLLSVPLLIGSYSDPEQTRSSVVTLWATDELRSVFSFESGEYAVDIADGQAVLDRGDIAFHLFEANKLSVGFVRNKGVRVVDLDDLQVPGLSSPRDQAAHPPLSIFHTLYVQGRTLRYRGPVARTYELKAADPVFGTLTSDSIVSFSPIVGHTYVMRYVPQRGTDTQERLIKFRVIDFEPGRQVTLRWGYVR